MKIKIKLNIIIQIQSKIYLNQENMFQQQATAAGHAGNSSGPGGTNIGGQERSPHRAAISSRKRTNLQNAVKAAQVGQSYRQAAGSSPDRRSGSSRGSRLNKLAAVSGSGLPTSVRKQRAQGSRESRGNQLGQHVAGEESGVQGDAGAKGGGKAFSTTIMSADGQKDGRYHTTQREPHLKQILQQPEAVQQNTVSYLRPVKLEGKDAMPIQVQNWTQGGGQRRIPEEGYALPGNQSKAILDRRARQQASGGQIGSQRSMLGGRGSAQFKTKLSQRQLIQKFDQLKAKQGGKKKGAQYEEYDTLAGANSGKAAKRKHASGAARGSPPKSPQTPTNRRDGKRQGTASPLPSAKRRQGKGGYLDALADKEAKQISMNSLQVGEEFEKDIKNIIEIIDGVEKNMCPQRLNQQFLRNANLSQNRRNLDMSRTIQAQQNHQSNFAAKQALLKMQYHSLNPQKPLSQSVANRFSQNNYGNQLAPGTGQQLQPQPFLLTRDATEKLALHQQMRVGVHGSTVGARYQPQQDRLTTPNLQTEHGTEIDGLGSGFDQHSKYRQNVLSGKTRGTFRIREGKRRPLTTKNVPNMVKQTHMKMQKSMQGRGQAGSLSGQFNVNFRGDSKNTAGERLDRDRSGGENTSDQLTGDNVTSHVTAAGNPAGLGKFSSKNFNNSRTNVGRYVTGGPSSRQVPANNPEVQSSNMAGTLANSHAYWINPTNQEYEIFSDQLQYQLKKDQEFYMMSPKIVGGPVIHNSKDRIASAKDVIQGLSYSGDGMARQINNTQSKDQALRVPEDAVNNNSANTPNPMRTNQVQINSNMHDNNQKEAALLAGREDQLQTLAGLPTGVSRHSPHTIQTFEQTTGRVAPPQHAMNQQQYSTNMPGTLSVSIHSQNAAAPHAAAFSTQDLQQSANGYHHGGLADNMTISQQPQDSRRPGRSPQGAQTNAAPNKLVMQVNKYIPHYQRIPPKLEKRDLKLFQEEYRYKDATLYKEAHAELKDAEIEIDEGKDPQALLIMEDVKADRHKKIQSHIINFDRVLIQSFFGNRERKYNDVYRNRLDLVTRDEGADGNALLDETSTIEQQQSAAQQSRSQPTGKRQHTVRKDSTISESVLGEAGYDSDEERDNAHRMFIDDLQTLRKFFIATVEEHVRTQEEMIANFNKERDFFLQSAQKSKEDLRGLQETIDGLYSEILEERDYSQKIWADEQVSLMCQKAMFTFKFMHQNQASKIQGLDIRDHPEGHIVVSKEEQEAVIKNKATWKESPQTPQQELQKSALASDRQDDEKQDASKTPSAEDDKQSEVSALPSPTQEKHEIEIQNLKWQIEYEKKLHKEMTQLLENKVSDLMAEVRHLEKDIKGLNGKIAEQAEEKDVLNQTILKLEERIKAQRAEIVDLQNETEDLKQKGGTLSQVSFDLLESRLTVERQENQQKAARIQQLEADLSRTVAALKDFHSRLVKLDNFAKFQTAQLEEQVNIKILEQSNRIQQVTETFKDALLLSNKTYFLEEVNKQKTEKKKLVQNAVAAGEQAEILQKKVKHVEQKLETILNDNLQLKQNLEEALSAKEAALKQAASVTPPEASAASPKKVLKDALRGSFLSSMRSAREKKAGGSGSNPGANNEKADQQPLDLDQFGINSPKAQHAKPAKTTKPQSPGGANAKISKQQNEPSEKSEPLTPFGQQKSLDLAGQSSGTPAGYANPNAGFAASKKFSREVLESEPEMSAASPDRSPFRK